MTPEERELLTKSIKLAEENNRMLRGIRRSARFSSFLRIVYWLIILGGAVGVYYFVKPLLDPFINGYNQMQKSVETVKNITVSFPPLPSWLGGSSATSTE
jgi:hypothetical protein